VLCESRPVAYSFTTTVTVQESQVKDGVWTATRLTADHELRAPASEICVAAQIAWTVSGS